MQDNDDIDFEEADRRSSPTFDAEWYSSGLSLLDLLVLIDSYSGYFQNSFKKRTEEISKTKERLKEYTQTIRIDKKIEDLKKGAEHHFDHLQEQVDAINDRLTREEHYKTRQKFSFFLGVNLIIITTVLFCLHPGALPAFYTGIFLVVIPLRIYTYRKKLYHYFLFDVCYFVNTLLLLYLWVFPKHTFLFHACYGLTMGTLGTAIITWRNSLVFHSLDKITSLAIHILPPLVVTALRHMDPAAPQKFPPVVEPLEPWKSFGISVLFYLLWQLLYYRYVIVARRDKIKAGRATSFTYLVNDKRRLIGKIAARVRPEWREGLFMLGQFVYTMATLFLPYFVFYRSLFASCVYLYFIFAVSSWSGASFYVEKAFKPLHAPTPTPDSQTTKKTS